MNSLSLGDLAQSFAQQRRSVAIRENMARLTQELSSGQVADVRQVLGGNTSYMTGIERSLDVLSAFSIANTEASQFAGGMQLALERVQDVTGQIANDLITSGAQSFGVLAGAPSDSAQAQLDTIINVLNGTVAGRSLFAGQATDRAPLASAEVLLDGVRTAVAGQTTPEDIRTAAQAWFDDPAGFVATMYSGADTALEPFQLSENDRIALTTTADDPAFRVLMRDLAVAALADDPALGLSRADQVDLFKLTGTGLLSSQNQLTDVRARIGFAEQRIEDVSARNAAEKTGLEYAKGALLSVDPFEVATRLEEAQIQLQSLYSATVRTSQLSLVNFL
ncbi:flagellin [Sulfitobacter sabulilitoris]|uniref:Flagellar hook protein n=1 Tax=Sulfitobacter sabulilitoris TaxID=2562655 RepID=A0A5S3PEN6_9RHOB|nr:flagellin [Sulfitobacter sabulilitoris]TMM52487.1 flagellar hook protein [Sulfitobacter sabulilitoris]